MNSGYTYKNSLLYFIWYFNFFLLLPVFNLYSSKCTLKKKQKNNCKTTINEIYNKLLTTYSVID